MSFSNPELLQAVNTATLESSIPENEIFTILEDAYKNAARSKYGDNVLFKVVIDRKNGGITLYRVMLVIDEDAVFPIEDKQNNTYTEDDLFTKCITISEAKLHNKDANIGDFIYEKLPHLQLKSGSMQSVQSFITEKIKIAKKKREYEEHKSKIGEIVNGVVTEVTKSGGIIVKLSTGADAMITKEHLLRSDYYKVGDKIKSYLLSIDSESSGYQIVLSRTYKEFVAALFKNAVPEIYDKIVEIKGIAREAGSKSKIAVYSADSSVDPIAACVGIKGARVKGIIAELNGEKIDVSLWSPDIAQFVINMLSPVQVLKIVIDEEKNNVEVVVADDQISQSIGRGGQNVRLMSSLIRWRLTITGETDEKNRRTTEESSFREDLMKILDIDEMLAQLLVNEGYESVDKIKNADVTKLGEIEGIDEDIAAELISRAKEGEEMEGKEEDKVSKDTYSDKKERNEFEEKHDAGEYIRALKRAGIRKLSDIAKLSNEELKEVFESFNMYVDIKIINKIITVARDRVYFHLSPTSKT